MTPAAEIFISSPITPIVRKRRWMKWALVISLILHITVALVVVYFCVFSTVGRRSTNLIIQDIELSSPLSAPLQPIATPSDQKMSVPTPPPQVRENEPPVLATPTEVQPVAIENIVKENGLTSTPLGQGMAHGYFSMLADGKTLRDDIRTYYFEMVEKINREWWDKAALLKEPLRADGIFEIIVQRDGSIISLRLLRGSGSSEADRLIAESVRKAAPLPALPATYEPDQFNAPLRIKAPLSLFRLKN
jgi:protein TonB